MVRKRSQRHPGNFTGVRWRSYSWGMSYTKADMREIFRRAVMLGMSWTYEGTTDEAAEELASSPLFDHLLKEVREEKESAKPKRFDAAKAIEDWMKRGKPAGEGVIPEFAEWLDRK